MKGRQRVLEPDSELADHKIRAAPLLGVLVLCQVLVAEAAAKVGDVPSVAALHDLKFGAAAQRLLIEGVGDDLAGGLGYAPVVEDLFDVEVEKRSLALRRCLYLPSHSLASSTEAK